MPLTDARPVRRTAVVAAVGLLATVAVTAVPSLRFAYRSEAGHLVIETCAVLVGGLVALMVYGRFRRSGAVQELLLAYGIGLLAVAALAFVTIPVAAGADPTSAITTWAPLLVRLVGAALLLAAAVVPGRRVVRTVHLRRDVLLCATLLVVLALGVQLLAALLPTAVTALPPPESSAHPRFDDHPVVLLVQAANLGCFAVASVLFTRQARHTGDKLFAWLGAAAALGAWARVNYLLFPSLYSEWLYTGDVLRLGFYLLLLVGAVQELRAYWTAQTEAAAFAERRRLARDLHDGAVQELGFLRTQARLVGDPELRARLLSTSERALDEARRALASLVAEADEPLADAVRRAVGEVGDRHDVPIRFLGPQEPVEVSAADREALVRIAREAVSNAVRHGSPRCVTVELRPGRLCVSDDGSGFDPEAAREDNGFGFGLTSMRDRAEGMGGHLVVDSAPGAGTRVEVTW